MLQNESPIKQFVPFPTHTFVPLEKRRIFFMLEATKKAGGLFARRKQRRPILMGAKTRYYDDSSVQNVTA